MTARVVIVGLGPGPRNTVTQATLDAIERIDVQFVRTKRHPTADLMPKATSFDLLYDTLPTFEDVYGAITEAVVAAALKHGEVLYAVPGSPLILESSVAQLRADTRVEVQVLPALSFLDLAWEAAQYINLIHFKLRSRKKNMQSLHLNADSKKIKNL